MSNSLVKRLDRKLRNNPAPRQLGGQHVPIDFASNDYLGLAAIPSRAMPRSGSGGSRLLTGNSALAEETEARLAAAFGYPRCLIYPSGYMANLGVLSCLPQRGDLILFDQYAHASIKDGARLSLASHQSFLHNDLDDLDRRLQKVNGHAYVVVESVYSMDGDEAPLSDLVRLVKSHDAELIVDEAHATAVRGNSGGGITQELGLQDEVTATIYTFGKGMGSHGAAVAATDTIVNYLVNFSRTFIYTTALPPSSLVHLTDALDKIGATGGDRKKLTENIARFRTVWKESGPAGLSLIPSANAIQAVICPGNERVRTLAHNIREDGFDVRPILAPTITKGRERIRVCLHAYNTAEEIDGLIRSFARHAP